MSSKHPRGENRYLSDTEVKELFGGIEYSIDGYGEVLANSEPFLRIAKLSKNGDISFPTYGGVAFTARCHKNIVYQLEQAFMEIEEKGLTSDIVFWGGCFNLRLSRGATNILSRHAWGIAFDINPEQNPIGAVPPAIGEYGSVSRLVPIFEKWGFYWGGNFPSPDGMHFEACRIITPEDFKDKDKDEDATSSDFAEDCDKLIKSILDIKEKWKGELI